jgi:hypothetical protein
LVEPLRFELIVEEKWIPNFERKGGIIRIYPNIITHLWGQLTLNPQFRKIRFNRFDGVNRVSFSGIACDAKIEPHISEIIYQFEAPPVGSKLRILSSNTYISIAHEQSSGLVDKGRENAHPVAEMVYEMVGKSLKRRGAKTNPTVLSMSTSGATSIAYRHKVGRALQELLPYASFLDVFQVNRLQEVAKEEIARRFELLYQDVTRWMWTHVKYVVIFPYLSKFKGEQTQNTNLFNDRLEEFLQFLIEFEAEHHRYAKSGSSAPAVDLERSRFLSQHLLLFPSTLNTTPRNLEDIEWFVDAEVLKGFRDELEDRLVIIGLFSSPERVNAVKSLIFSPRAVAICSATQDTKYIIGIRIREEEVKDLLERLKQPARG